MTTPRPHATLACELRDQADFDEAESVFGSGSYTRELMREAADTIDTLSAQLAKAQRDSERLDWMIEQCAYVVRDPDCCDGYWLNYPRKDGPLWVQTTEHETPRAAIDAARTQTEIDMIGTQSTGAGANHA